MLKGFVKIAILYFLLLPLLSQGQSQTIRGITFKRSMLQKIADVDITNLKTADVSRSGSFGDFTIKANLGDTLQFEKPGFTIVKQVVASYSPLYVILLPNINLGEVSIRGQSKKQELNDVVNDYRSKGIYYDGKPPALAYVFQPLTVLHELFGSDAKNERRFMRYAKGEMEATEVSRKYTPRLVSNTTGLTGVELDHFMDNYTPAHDDIVKWNDYQIIMYIKKSYETYKRVGYKPPVDIFKK